MSVENSSGSRSWLALVWPVFAVIAVAIALGWLARSTVPVGDAPIAAQPKPWVNSFGMEFVLIPAGEWTPLPGRGLDQARSAPVAEFYLGKTEVTQDVWRRVMGSNPSQFQDPRRPVDQVSWFEAQEFVQRLNRIERTDKYRLPTELEWEYAARAGTTTPYFFGADAVPLARYAWFGHTQTQKGTRPVAQREPNPWGLFDIYGNVWEWTLDCWTPALTPPSQRGQPQLRGDCADRVLRGGGWNSTQDYVGSAARGSYAANLNDYSNGVRIVRSVER